MAFLQASNKDAQIIVDDELEKILSNFTWAINNDGYAITTIGARTVSIHRFILGIARKASELVVDHVDRNPLNNTRSNLRVCNHSQNIANRKARGPHGFKGICLIKRSGLYLAQIKANDKNISLGRYKTPEEAARAYDKAAKELHGEFARLNFPEASA